MRIAVFSDVHADAVALGALCSEFADAEIETVWCLGDFASGGHEAAECFDLTMGTAQVVLAGNHEGFVRWRAFEHLRAGWALYAKLAHHQLGRERLARLATLEPYALIPELGVELAHGSLLDPWDGFVSGAADAYLTLQKASQPLVLVGHTHRAAYFREPSPGAIPEDHPIELDHEYVLDRPSILNPGAGRDGDHVRWLELRLDDRQRTAAWHRCNTQARSA
jgi:predicted phosphodiesterase